MNKIILTITIIFVSAFVFARTAFPTLSETSSVRSDAMGGTGDSLSLGIDGMLINPAQLAEARAQEFSTFFLGKPDSGILAGLSYALPVGKKTGTLGFSLIYFDAGSMDVTYYDGSSATLSAQRDFYFAAGYGFAMTRDITAGLNVKALSTTLAGTYSATVLAADIGVKYTMFDGPVIGLSLRNAGLPAKFVDVQENLPMTVSVGASYPVKMSGTDKLTFAAQGDYNVYDTLQAGFGAEYVYQDLLSVRAGYRLNQDSGNITAGIGFKQKFDGLGIVNLDYAFLFGDGWMDSHKLSLGIKF